MNLDYNCYACLIAFVGGFVYGYFIGFFRRQRISIKKGVMAVEGMRLNDED